MEPEAIWAALPNTTRGQPTVLSTDPKGERIAYAVREQLQYLPSEGYVLSELVSRSSRRLQQHREEGCWTTRIYVPSTERPGLPFHCASSPTSPSSFDRSTTLNKPSNTYSIHNRRLSPGSHQADIMLPVEMCLVQ